MAVRFFGQYLLENQVIKSDQLLAALDHQAKLNLRFGEQAKELGLLDEAKIGQILALQRTRDLKAGEAAIHLGFLTQAKVEQILLAQRNSHVHLGEAMVAIGVMTRDELERHLALFQKEQQSFHFVAEVPAELDPSGLGRIAVDLSAKLLLRLAGVTTRLVGCRAGAVPEMRGATRTAQVAFTGDVEGEVALRSSPRLFAAIAGSVLGERVRPEDDEILLDGTKEFLNVVCGNMAAAAARVGKRIELEPPKSGGLRSITPLEHLLVAELKAPDGELHLAVLTRTRR